MSNDISRSILIKEIIINIFKSIPEYSSDYIEKKIKRYNELIIKDNKNDDENEEINKLKKYLLPLELETNTINDNIINNYKYNYNKIKNIIDADENSLNNIITNYLKLIKTTNDNTIIYDNLQYINKKIILSIKNNFLSDDDSSKKKLDNDKIKELKDYTEQQTKTINKSLEELNLKSKDNIDKLSQEIENLKKEDVKTDNETKKIEKKKEKINKQIKEESNKIKKNFDEIIKKINLFINTTKNTKSDLKNINTNISLLENIKLDTTIIKYDKSYYDNFKQIIDGLITKLTANKTKIELDIKNIGATVAPTTVAPTTVAPMTVTPMTVAPTTVASTTKDVGKVPDITEENTKYDDYLYKKIKLILDNEKNIEYVLISIDILIEEMTYLLKYKNTAINTIIKILFKLNNDFKKINNKKITEITEKIDKYNKLEKTEDLIKKIISELFKIVQIQKIKSDEYIDVKKSFLDEIIFYKFNENIEKIINIEYESDDDYSYDIITLLYKLLKNNDINEIKNIIKKFKILLNEFLINDEMYIKKYTEIFNKLNEINELINLLLAMELNSLFVDKVNIFIKKYNEVIILLKDKDKDTSPQSNKTKGGNINESDIKKLKTMYINNIQKLINFIKEIINKKIDNLDKLIETQIGFKNSDIYNKIFEDYKTFQDSNDIKELLDLGIKIIININKILNDLKNDEKININNIINEIDKNIELNTNDIDRDKYKEEIKKYDESIIINTNDNINKLSKNAVYLSDFHNLFKIIEKIDNITINEKYNFFLIYLIFEIVQDEKIKDDSKGYNAINILDLLYNTINKIKKNIRDIELLKHFIDIIEIIKTIKIIKINDNNDNSNKLKYEKKITNKDIIEDYNNVYKKIVNKIKEIEKNKNYILIKYNIINNSDFFIKDYTYNIYKKIYLYFNDIKTKNILTSMNNPEIDIYSHDNYNNYDEIKEENIDIELKDLLTKSKLDKIYQLIIKKKTIYEYEEYKNSLIKNTKDDKYKFDLKIIYNIYKYYIDLNKRILINDDNNSKFKKLLNINIITNILNEINDYNNKYEYYTLELKYKKVEEKDEDIKEKIKDIKLYYEKIKELKYDKLIDNFDINMEYLNLYLNIEEIRIDNEYINKIRSILFNINIDLNKIYFIIFQKIDTYYQGDDTNINAIKALLKGIKYSHKKDIILYYDEKYEKLYNDIIIKPDNIEIPTRIRKERPARIRKKSDDSKDDDSTDDDELDRIYEIPGRSGGKIIKGGDIKEIEEIIKNIYINDTKNNKKILMIDGKIKKYIKFEEKMDKIKTFDINNDDSIKDITKEDNYSIIKSRQAEIENELQNEKDEASKESTKTENEIIKNINNIFAHKETYDIIKKIEIINEGDIEKGERNLTKIIEYLTDEKKITNIYINDLKIYRDKYKNFIDIIDKDKKDKLENKRADRGLNERRSRIEVDDEHTSRSEGGGIKELTTIQEEYKKTADIYKDKIDKIKIYLKQIVGKNEIEKEPIKKVLASNDNFDVSIFEEMLSSYDTDIKNKEKIKEEIEDDFYNKVKLNNLDPEDNILINTNDKIIFIIIVYILRIISLYIVEYLIEKNSITDIITSIKYYLLIYFILLIAIVLIVNLDTYKLRILINYLNFHSNSSRIYTHILIVLILYYIIYLFIININDKIEKKPYLNEIEKTKLSYKLDILTIIVYIFICIISMII